MKAIRSEALLAGGRWRLTGGSVRWRGVMVAVAAGVTLAASGTAWGAAGTATKTPETFGPPPSTMRTATTRPAASGRFYSVAATSSRNVWAVGLQQNGSLIMHWSGSRTKRYRWRVSFTKPVGFFYGVAATSAGNAWAVGGTDWFSPVTLAEHWNGKTWTRVPAPAPGGTGWFEGVAATSRNNAWAVGGIGPGPGVDNDSAPLIEQWNGQSWSQAHYPGPAGGQLKAVAATSASNAWAVGWIGSGPTTQTLIEHWDGTSWTQVPSNTPGALGILQGVAATGPDNAWAVGYTQSGPGGSYLSLILHWNGQVWSVVRSPNPTGQTNLWGVAAASPRNAWAVGFTNPNTCSPQCGTAAFHWNGTRWAVVPSLNPAAHGLNMFADVVDLSPTNAWAVGTTDWSATVIEHWNGKKWIWHLPR